EGTRSERSPQGVGKVLAAFSRPRRRWSAAMILEHNGVQIEVPPHIVRRIRRHDWQLLLALLGFAALTVLSLIGVDEILIDARVTNGFVSFIVPVANLAAVVGVIGFFAFGINRRHRREQALLDFYQRTGRWPD